MMRSFFLSVRFGASFKRDLNHRLGEHVWSAAEQMRFLRSLPETLSAVELARLDWALNLSGIGINEIKFLWLEAELRNRYEPAVAQAEAFLSTVGRNKFVLPLFKSLVEEGD